MENIIVSSFKRNDSYDYEVDIKASDYEPAAASECSYLDYSINALKPISYGLLHYNPPPQSGGGNEQIRGLTKSSIIDDPGDDNSSGSYEYISSQITDQDVDKSFVIFLDGVQPSQNMLYGTIKKNNDGKLYLKARTYNYYDNGQYKQIDFPINNDRAIEGVKHYTSTNPWVPSQKGNITLTIKASTCEITVANSENTIYLLGNVGSNVQYPNSVFEVTSYKTDRTVTLSEDKSLKLYGKVNNNNGKFSTKAKKIGYSENDYMIQILSFYDETNHITIPLNLLSGTLKLKSTKIIPPFVDVYAYVEIDVNPNDGTIYLKNTITEAAYDSENGYYPIFAIDDFNTQYVLRLRNNYNENNVQASQSWWGDVGLNAGDIIKRGTILKVTNRVIDQTRSSAHYGKEVYDSTYPFLPAYIIAKEDYTITGNGYNDYLNIGLPVDWGDEDAPYGKIDTQIKISDSNIWESCTPSDPYARSKPWSFVTEGIVTDYISFQWNDKYNEPGTFTLALVATQENMDLFKEDRYIMISSSDRVMMIENVEFNVNLKADGYIMTVSGRSLEAILERRAIFPGQGLSTNEYKGPDGLCKALYDLVDGFFMNPEKVATISSDGQKAFYYPERRVPFLKLPEDRDSLIKRVFHQSINLTVSKDDVLKIVQEQCKQTDLGFKIIPKKRYGSSKCIEWEFCLYTGKDKSYGRSDTNNPLMVFSPTIGNVEAISTVKDSKNYRNVIFCGVEKESDGYIDLTKDVNDANYWGQKTGVEIVDSINSNATNLISGVKNSLVTKLEASPVCYTGILFLALAAMRNDCNYQPTVNKIVKNTRDPYVLVENGEMIFPNNNHVDMGPDNPFYMVAYKNIHGTDPNFTYSEKIFIQACVIVESGKYNIYVKPSGENLDRIYFDWGLSYPITCDIEYFYINNEAYGKLKPVSFAGDSIVPDPNGHIINNLYVKDGVYYLPLYAYQDDTEHTSQLVTNTQTVGGHWVEDDNSIDGYSWVADTTSATELVSDDSNAYNVAAWVRIHIYGEIIDSGDEKIVAYPSKYIEKKEAQNIYIVYRQAYGDNDTSYYGNKTGSFRLSAVNPACAQDGEIDFKTSTGFGWLTIPILKQAITDLNNTTFSKLSMLKKSAIQAWFKTLDKYTGSKNQMRWLCQEHVQNSSMIGLDRREVFVEEDKSDDTDWNASKINQWQQNTKEIAVDQNEDEETDEQINERLLKTARKKSGEYRRTRDIDASLDLTEYEYDPSGIGIGPNLYTLGDIIQIDDGYGNLEKYLINGVTQSMDTTSGPKIVPSFEKYELIPKQYHRLEWIQVANMMLPAKFNPRYSGVNRSPESNLPSNVYFGSMAKNRDNEVEQYQNDLLGNIDNIVIEQVMKFTEIEADIQYVKNESANPSSDVDRQGNFALISAIGSKRRTLEYSAGNNIFSMPMTLLETSYSSPFNFMSNSQIPEITEEGTRNIYLYISNTVEWDLDEYYNDRYSYNYGGGYKNKYVERQIDNIDNYIYKSTANNERATYFINKLVYDDCYITDDGSSSGFDSIYNKTMLYSKSYKKTEPSQLNPSGEEVISYRPQAPSYMVLLWDDINNKISGARFIDSGFYLNGSQDIYGMRAYIVDDAASNQCLRFNNYLNNGFKPYYSNNNSVYIMTGSSWWGQDNYNNKTYTDLQSSRYDRNLFDYENNIVIGGCGYYLYNYSNSVLDYELHFADPTNPEEEIIYDDIKGRSPKASDTANGTRTYSIKIYETDSSVRAQTFSNTSNLDFVYNDGNRPSQQSYYWYDRIIYSYYPDLNTRVLAHEYVPVVYVDAEEDTPDEEKYGLYDITEQTFVPVNFGGNSAATFIAAGGEIIDQE